VAAVAFSGISRGPEAAHRRPPPAQKVGLRSHFASARRETNFSITKVNPARTNNNKTKSEIHLYVFISISSLQSEMRAFGVWRQVAGKHCDVPRPLIPAAIDPKIFYRTDTFQGAPCVTPHKFLTIFWSLLVCWTNRISTE
jgi:hypothetical protein